MKTPHILRLLLACLPVSVFVLLACQKEIAGDGKDGSITSAPSAVKVFLTDHQTPVFDSVLVDIRQLEVKLEDDSLLNDGWMNLSIRPGVYNLLRFRNGLDTLVATGSLPNNRVRKVRLTLGTQNSAVRGNQTFPLRVKESDRQVVLNLTENNFDFVNGQVFFWLDFDAAGSIKIDNSGSGNNNGFELKPKIKAFGKANTGRMEGKILPLAASPVVQAVLGGDTATAIPERTNGEFKIIGLNAGNYTLIVTGQNGYRDTVLTNVRVVNREETRLAIITLRQ